MIDASKNNKNIKESEIKIIKPGEDYSDAMKVRYAVFVEEQKIAYERETDDYDKSSYHVVLYIRQFESHIPIACGRLYKDCIDEQVRFKSYENNAAHIGRVAVLKEYRRKGYATFICNRLIEIARSLCGINTVILHSQKYAVPLYLKLGFYCVGKEFLEENIPHFEMHLKL